MNSRPRLVLCGRSFGHGGAETQLLRLAGKLSSDFEVIVLTGTPQPELTVPPNIEVICLVERDSFGQRIQRGARVVSACRALDPDLVYSRFPLFNVMLARARSKAHLECPVVIQEVVEPTPHFQRGLQRRALSWAMLQYYPRADLVLGNGHRVVKDLSCNFKIPGERCLYLPNLAPRRQEGVVKEHKSAVRNIVAVGRLEEQKGFSVLIEAFRVLRDLWPETGEISLAILGQGSLKNRLQRQVRRAGLADHVRLHGWVADPRCLMQRADVFVSSSLYEGMSNVVMEAMSMGLPVVATEVSGSIELLRPEVDAIVVPPDDVKALALGLSRLIASSRLRRQLGTSALDRIECFESEVVARRYSETFQRLIEFGRAA